MQPLEAMHDGYGEEAAHLQQQICKSWSTAWGEEAVATQPQEAMHIGSAMYIGSAMQSGSGEGPQAPNRLQSDASDAA